MVFSVDFRWIGNMIQSLVSILFLFFFLFFFWWAEVTKARKKEVEYIQAEKLRVTKCAFDRSFELPWLPLILKCSINKPTYYYATLEFLSGRMQAIGYRIWNCFFQLLITWMGFAGLLASKEGSAASAREAPAIGAWGLLVW